MNKILLNEIINYIPNLKVKCADTGEILIGSGISYSNIDNDAKIECTKVEDGGAELCRYLSLNDQHDEDNEYAIPLLRPMSDIYHEIEHTGSQIIPLIEIAKELSGLVWKFSKDNKKISIYDDDKGTLVYAVSNTREEIEMILNILVLNIKSFSDSISFSEKLYRKLYEYQFDVHNLIGRGLAQMLLNDTLLSIDKTLNTLSHNEKHWLSKWANQYGTKSILHNLLSKEDAMKANYYIKMGLFCEGASNDKNKNIMYHMDNYVYSKL